MNEMRWSRVVSVVRKRASELYRSRSCEPREQQCLTQSIVALIMRIDAWLGITVFCWFGIGYLLDVCW